MRVSYKRPPSSSVNDTRAAEIRSRTPRFMRVLHRDLWCAAGGGFPGILFRVGVFTVPFFFLIAMLLWWGEDLPSEALLGAVVASICMIVTAITLDTLRQGRLFRALKANQHRLCVNCHYPLPPTPAADRCPECGSAYVLAETVAYWMDPLKAEKSAISQAAAPTPPPLPVAPLPADRVAHPTLPPTESAPGTVAE